jgi:hypothetical protein
LSAAEVVGLPTKKTAFAVSGHKCLRFLASL